MGCDGVCCVMVSMNQIEELERRIGHQFRASKVILLGSYANGSATDDSDVNLLVIAEPPPVSA